MIHGIRTFLPILLEQGGEGHVVNTASLSGLIALPNAGPYDATKFAVVAISESLYFDLALIKSLIHVPWCARRGFKLEFSMLRATGRPSLQRARTDR